MRCILRLLYLRLNLFLGFLTKAHELGLRLHVVPEFLIPVLVDAAAGVAAGGALLGVREFHVRVYGLYHSFFVGGEGGAGLHVPAGDAFVAHPTEPRAAVGVYDVLAVFSFGERYLDIEEAVGEHDDVHGVLHGLDLKLLARVAALLLPNAGHGEPAYLLPVVAKVRSEEHTSELKSRQYLVCRLLLEEKTPELCSAMKLVQGMQLREVLHTRNNREHKCTVNAIVDGGLEVDTA